MTSTTGPNDRLIRWLIVTAMATFTLALHVTFPNMGGAGLRLPFNATVWMGFSLMIAISLWPMTRGVIRYSNFHIGLALLVAILWAPLAWSWGEASLIALPRLLGLTAGALLLLGLAQLELTRRHWWWLGMSIFAGTLMETAYAYIQQFMLEPGNWVGYDPDYGRPYGIFQQPNVLASFLATGLAISAWLYNESRNRLEGGITLLAPLFMPTMLLIIMSRTGWLATIIVVPMVLFYLWHQKRQRFLIWGGAFIAGCLFALFINSLGDAARSETPIQSSGERYHVYTHSLRMILEKPFLGWGYGRFQHDFLHSFADWRAAQPINQPEIVESFINLNYSHPHNELFLWGIEGGLLPVFAILSMAGWLGWSLWRNGPINEKIILAALITPLAIHSMTEHPFYHSQGSWLTFLILIGLISNLSFHDMAKTYRHTFGIRTGAWLALPLTFAFMATHLQTLWKVADHMKDNNKNTQTLGEIINPFGINQELSFMIMGNQLNSAVELGNHEALKNYIAWSNKASKLNPTISLYKNSLRAHKALDNLSEALPIIELSKHLYPMNKSLSNAGERVWLNKAIDYNESQPARQIIRK